MTTCEQYLVGISLLVDGMLDGRELVDLEAHLAVCPDCAARRDAFAAMRSVMPDFLETPPDTLTPGIMSEIDRADRRRARSSRRRLIPLGAAAAVVALALLWNQALFVNKTNGTMDPQQKIELASIALPAEDDASSADQAETAPEDAVSVPEVELFAAEALPTDAPAGEDGEAWAAGTGRDAGAAYAATVTLHAEQIPEQLEGYPRRDGDGWVEITLPVEDFYALWPGLRSAGVENADGIDEVLREYNSQNREKAQSDAVETNRKTEQALIIVYLD